MAQRTIFFLSGTTQIVPADFLSLVKISIVGAGADGAASQISGGAPGPGVGGGSGGYAETSSGTFTPGSTISTQIGVHGGGDVSGNDTWIKDSTGTIVCLAEAGGGQNGGGLGGRQIGSLARNGTNGGSAGGSTLGGAGAGAGASGPTSNGGQGGSGSFQNSGGGGGGGADNNAASGNGANGGSNAGGNGGVSGSGGTVGSGATAGAGATSGNNGNGAGGGNASFPAGANGTNEAMWTQSSDGAIAGPGGGGGGGGQGVGGVGGAGGGYGAGGGGGGNDGVTVHAGGNGAPSIIVFIYNTVPFVNYTTEFVDVRARVVPVSYVYEHQISQALYAQTPFSPIIFELPKRQYGFGLRQTQLLGSPKIVISSIRRFLWVNT